MSQGNIDPVLDARQRIVEQHVWAIIRASGGWNARAQSRLAYFAAAKKVEAWRIVAAVRRVSGEPSAGAPTATLLAAPSNVSSTASSSDPSHTRVHDVHSDVTRGILIAGLAFAAALALSAGMVWYALHRVEQARNLNANAATEKAGGAGPSAVNANPAQPDGADASDPLSPPLSSGPVAPVRTGNSTRTVPPAPAVFVKPPMLLGDLATAWLRGSLETLSAEEAWIERSTTLSTAFTDAEIIAYRRVCDAFLESWPVLDPARRTVVLDALIRGGNRLSDAAREDWLQVLHVLGATQESTPRAWWLGAGAAGLAAAQAQSGAGSVAEEFAQGALTWLALRAPAVADSAARSDPGLAADLCESWLAALDSAAALSGSEPHLLARDAAVQRALDALLKSNAPLDRSGTPADAAGTLLDSLPWSGPSARRQRLAEALGTWMADASISSRALYGLTSVLSARRPGSWWDPWLVADARAIGSERIAIGQRYAQALAGEGGGVNPTSPTIRGVDPELLRRWSAARRALAAKGDAMGMPARVARSAEWMALVEAARMLERGRSSDADARISQLEVAEGFTPAEADRWREGKPTAPTQVPVVDGKLEGELRSRRSLEDRQSVLRSLRTRPIRDLGPLDAETLAREALSAPAEQMRTVAQGVVVDSFDKGPHVLRALLAEVAGAASGAEAAQLAATLSGVPAPRGNDAAMRAAAALMLADLVSGLASSDRHALDAATRELSLSAVAAARLLGGDAVAGMNAHQAMHAWAVARAADATRTVPSDALEPILARAAARRKSAEGLPQLFASDQTLLLELEAAHLTERMPRRRAEIQAILQRAAAARSHAADIVGQIQSNAVALSDLAAIALGVTLTEEAP
jgi:hypothetical protein